MNGKRPAAPGVINNGTRATVPFSIRYVLSTNTSFDSYDPIMGTTTFTSGLLAGQRGYATLSGYLPTVTSGNYYVIWYIDYYNQVGESNENDNLWRTSTTLPVYH